MVNTCRMQEALLAFLSLGCGCCVVRTCLKPSSRLTGSVPASFLQGLRDDFICFRLCGFYALFFFSGLCLGHTQSTQRSFVSVFGGCYLWCWVAMHCGDQMQGSHVHSPCGLSLPAISRPESAMSQALEVSSSGISGLHLPL